MSPMKYCDIHSETDDSNDLLACPECNSNIWSEIYESSMKAATLAERMRHRDKLMSERGEKEIQSNENRSEDQRPRREAPEKQEKEKDEPEKKKQKK
ncbi:unnamed protein product [Penicillium pancosmium]